MNCVSVCVRDADRAITTCKGLGGKTDKRRVCVFCFSVPYIVCACGPTVSYSGFVFITILPIANNPPPLAVAVFKTVSGDASVKGKQPDAGSGGGGRKRLPFI